MSEAGGDTKRSGVTSLDLGSDPLAELYWEEFELERQAAVTRAGPYSSRWVTICSGTTSLDLVAADSLPMHDPEAGESPLERRPPVDTDDVELTCISRICLMALEDLVGGIAIDSRLNDGKAGRCLEAGEAVATVAAFETGDSGVSTP